MRHTHGHRRLSSSRRKVRGSEVGKGLPWAGRSCLDKTNCRQQAAANDHAPIVISTALITLVPTPRGLKLGVQTGATQDARGGADGYKAQS